MARQSQYRSQNKFTFKLIKEHILAVIFELKFILAETIYSFLWGKEALFPTRKISKSKSNLIVQIPQSVYFEIIATCLRSMGKKSRTYFAQQGKEISGGLIGYKVKDETGKTYIKIPFLLDSSLAIVSDSAGHVTTDGDFQQAALEHYNEKGFLYLGDYHLHPDMNWSMLSPTDFYGVRNMLDEPDNGIDEMIMLLVNIDLKNTTSRKGTLAQINLSKSEQEDLVSELNQLLFTSADFNKYIRGKPVSKGFPLTVNSIFQVRAFYMHKKQMFVRKLRLEVVPEMDFRDHPQYLKKFWGNPLNKDFWYDGAEGQDRIKQEKELLKGLGLKVKIKMTDRLGLKTLAFILENSKLWLSKKVIFYLSEDYPRYSPTWMVTDGDTYYRQGAITPWYKTSFLIHALAVLENKYHQELHQLTVKEKIFFEALEKAKQEKLATLWLNPPEQGGANEIKQQT